MGGVFFGLLQVKLWFNSIDSTLKGSMNHTFVLSILKALVDSSMIQTYTNLYAMFQYSFTNCTVCLWEKLDCGNGFFYDMCLKLDLLFLFLFFSFKILLNRV
jgi:hypothetical protein